MKEMDEDTGGSVVEQPAKPKTPQAAAPKKLTLFEVAKRAVWRFLPRDMNPRLHAGMASDFGERRRRGRRQQRSASPSPLATATMFSGVLFR